MVYEYPHIDALKLAISHGHAEIVKFLVDRCPNYIEDEDFSLRTMGNWPIHLAIKNENFELVKVLSHEFKILNSEPDVMKVYYPILSPLHLAAIHGNQDIVKYLLTISNTPNESVYYKGTPIFLAAQYGHYEVVKAFIEHLGMISHKSRNSVFLADMI